MSTLLISDLHLHPGAPELSDRFLDWLDTRARGNEALFILGDFFDAWIGDDLLDLGDDPTGHARLARRVVDALRRLSDGGTAVYIMHGNRDFLIGERFAGDAGATLLADPSVVSLGDQPVLLMHGDSLCTGDEAYQAFRTQAREDRWQRQILSLPIPERLALAHSLREQSGEATSNKAEAIMDVTPDEVVRVMQAHGVATLIHGHTHRPAVHELEVDGQPARRMVLGDWQPGQGWEIEVNQAGHPELKAFPLG
ncbi:UDP-2,3-diacylglucosamine diphosphatase [Billgrantia gudaonensis]|uniref:UDP-2,3-diacylglucosamine hydrolase n=1 Tax=Billgrantia gudaonensis TaxID=376427 RepID=A0A1G8WTA1_9GAMM|nr:UDP-2,3-diacylglucosamine diphosphatase [Halomonas gudaonensis]SDJ81451.1 UDP-2,3-diacylglucosamine hydrolase [Halomonas gudaonensis]